ncbi:hypothetical protein Pd630_LPD06895 [Rhodococcus opacus PD630]|nr:hypothetical protein Pd630_LPD06895 [Rhodococcus opacus PD630]
MPARNSQHTSVDIGVATAPGHTHARSSFQSNTGVYCNGQTTEIGSSHE